jgi:hypothetical protein
MLGTILAAISLGDFWADAWRLVTSGLAMALILGVWWFIFSRLGTF